MTVKYMYIEGEIYRLLLDKSNQLGWPPLLISFEYVQLGLSLKKCPIPFILFLPAEGSLFYSRVCERWPQSLNSLSRLY